MERFEKKSHGSGAVRTEVCIGHSNKGVYKELIEYIIERGVPLRKAPSLP